MSLAYKRSCLRWPGNKFNLLKSILSYFPNEYNDYHEPFLGSATVFINANITGIAYISDCNKELINFYLQLRDNVDELIALVKEKENSKDFFYKERVFNYYFSVEQAAQFYFLNRTCYNGVYRVNSKGVFNVPYGRRESMIVLDEKNLYLMSEKLSNAELNVCDFFESIINIKENDFVYLDPPYSGKLNNNFSMYNDKLFKWDDQIRLQEFCRELMSRNANFVINNLYNEEVYSLFSTELGLNSIVTERPLVISSKLSSRRTYSEYLFTNVNI